MSQRELSQTYMAQYLRERRASDPKFREMMRGYQKTWEERNPEKAAESYRKKVEKQRQKREALRAAALRYAAEGEAQP